MSAPKDIQCLRVKIVKDLDSHHDDLDYDPELKDFVVTSKDDTVKILRTDLIS